MDKNTILFVVVVALGVILLLIGKFVIYPKIRKKYFSCNKCKTHLDYDNDIEWCVIKEYTTQSSTDTRLKADVKFTMHCPKCGTVSTAKYTFVTRIVDHKTGNIKDYDLEERIKKFYK